MSPKTLLLAAAAAVSLAGAALADHAHKIMVQDAYARVSSPAAKSGAAFMQIMNHSGGDDRLVEVKSEAAARTELHTHKDGGDGVMQMVHVEEGFALADGETLVLQRGGNHVMLMGLKQPLEQGATVPLVLVFEKAGEITVEVPVDLERQPDHGSKDHSEHSH